MSILTDVIEVCHRPQKICGPLERGGRDLELIIPHFVRNYGPLSSVLY